MLCQFSMTLQTDFFSQQKLQIFSDSISHIILFCVINELLSHRLNGNLYFTFVMQIFSKPQNFEVLIHKQGMSVLKHTVVCINILEHLKPSIFIPPAYEVCHGGIMFLSFLCVCVCVCVCLLTIFVSAP